MQPTWQRIILLTVIAYEAFGGFTGGVLLIAEPGGSYMDMPVEIMNGVFENFMIPGIILLAMGILNAFAFFSVLRRRRNDWIMATLAMGGFIIWFVVEITILQELHWLHLMWGLPVLLAFMVTIPLLYLRNNTPQMLRGLLICGILSSAWYIIINAFVPTQYDGYSQSTFTVSELSAIGAPTRVLWVLLVILYPLLLVSFGWGILKSTTTNIRMRIAGSLIVAYCFFNMYWPPMHLRGNEATLTDTMHIVWAFVTVLLMVIIMGFGAFSLNKRFRNYTILSILVLFFFGALTAGEAPNITTNEPTPMIGIWERINIGVFMIWVIVFAVALLQKQKVQLAGQSVR